MYCPRCGHLNKKNSDECPVCGYDYVLAAAPDARGIVCSLASSDLFRYICVVAAAIFVANLATAVTGALPMYDAFIDMLTSLELFSSFDQTAMLPVRDTVTILFMISFITAAIPAGLTAISLWIMHLAPNRKDAAGGLLRGLDMLRLSVFASYAAIAVAVALAAGAMYSFLAAINPALPIGERITATDAAGALSILLVLSMFVLPLIIFISLLILRSIKAVRHVYTDGTVRPAGNGLAGFFTIVGGFGIASALFGGDLTALFVGLLNGGFYLLLGTLMRRYNRRVLVLLANSKDDDR